MVVIYLAAQNISAAPCPRNGFQSQVWVEQAVSSLVRAARAAYVNEAAEDMYKRVVSQTARTIGRCQLAQQSELSRRYPEFFRYVTLLSIANQDDHELGFEVSDKQYFAETSQYTSIPDFLLTPAFLRLVSRFENLAAAKSFLNDLNRTRAPNNQLLFFSYTSRHLGTPDNPDSYRRLLIVVPGDAARSVPEKWVQFGIADPRRPRSVRNVSVVAVMLRAGEGANVYFKDYFRTYRRDGSISIKGRWELDEGDDACVTCHKSGALPIFPKAGSVSREEQPLVEAVNQRFRGYGAARFGRYLDLTKFGPGLGSSPPQTDSRKVSFAMTANRFKTQSCIVCHNPNGLGPFNWPMDSTLIRSFVTGGKMPLNATLTIAERRLLYDQLVNDYFAINTTQPGILQAWLLGKIRSTDSNANSSER
jgi:mono/diheme cytochrome c family protein